MKRLVLASLLFLFLMNHYTLIAQVNFLWSSTENFSMIYDYENNDVAYYYLPGNNSLDFYDPENFILEYSLAIDPNNNHLVYPDYLIPDMNSNGHREILIESIETNTSVKIFDLDNGNIIYQWEESGIDLRAQGPYQSTSSNDLRVNIYKVVNPPSWSEPSVYSLGVSPNSIEYRGNNDQVENYQLNQNFPNPFNSNTTIRYSTSSPDDISIKIFDISGQLIKEINKEHNQPGEYEVIWDGTNNFGKKVSSGTYFYSRVSGSFTSAKKMILLK